MVAINWSNFTDMGQLPAAANTATGNSFWVGILQMLWVIMFILLIGAGFEIALLASAFIGLVLAIILVYAGLVNWIYLVQFAGIILSTILYIIWSGRKVQCKGV